MGWTCCEPEVMKKNIDLAITLIKAETVLLKKHLNKEDISDYAHSIFLIKTMLGYDNL